MTTRSTPTIGADDRYDAIVVGARPAGAATAMLLGRAGRRVLLVERAQYGADTLSTHALMRGGVLQLHRWGLLDAVRDAGTPPDAPCSIPSSSTRRARRASKSSTVYAQRGCGARPMAG
jgi:2-polyprenyl-6-methoxyphenol hydroxylase-like FAD-dependent oxidoreductase